MVDKGAAAVGEPALSSAAPMGASWDFSAMTLAAASAYQASLTLLEFSEQGVKLLGALQVKDIITPTFRCMCDADVNKCKRRIVQPGIYSVLIKPFTY